MCCQEREEKFRERREGGLGREVGGGVRFGVVCVCLDEDNFLECPGSRWF